MPPSPPLSNLRASPARVLFGGPRNVSLTPAVVDAAPDWVPFVVAAAALGVLVVIAVSLAIYRKCTSKQVSQMNPSKVAPAPSPHGRIGMSGGASSPKSNWGGVVSGAAASGGGSGGGGGGGGGAGGGGDGNGTEWPAYFDAPLGEPLPGSEQGAAVKAEGHLRMMVLTWNLKERLPESDLTAMLQPGAHHMYVIGAQECGAKLKSAMGNKTVKEWIARIQAALGPSYKVVQKQNLMAISLVVFLHTSLVDTLSDIKSSTVATGIGNTLGNKGGVGIAFSVGKTKFLCVTSHLAPHAPKVAARNSQFKQISKGLLKSLAPKGAPKPPKNGLLPTAGFDHVFWAGDLNYRINGERAWVDQQLAKNTREAYQNLIRHDQLRDQHSQGLTFMEFEEGPLFFRPTYKYDVGTDVYDTSKKQRVPSWTDRVLWWSAAGAAGAARQGGQGDSKADDDDSAIESKLDAGAARGCEVLRYASVDDVKVSDHRAVYAIFRVPVSLG